MTRKADRWTERQKDRKETEETEEKTQKFRYFTAYFAIKSLTGTSVLKIKHW